MKNLFYSILLQWGGGLEEPSPAIVPNSQGSYVEADNIESQFYPNKKLKNQPHYLICSLHMLVLAFGCNVC